MLYKIISYLNFKAFLNKGDARTIKIKKNISGSLLIKGVSAATGFLIIPLTIDYVNSSLYGIWLSLSSIVSWLSFFDIGFGNGFRNKFAIAKANNDRKLIKRYVSTVYVSLFIIFSALWLLFLTFDKYIHWHELLNFDKELEQEVAKVAVIVVSYFCLQFVLKIINTILIADQRPAISSLIDTLGQVLTLIVIYILTLISEGSLYNLALALTICPIFVLLLSNIYFFINDYYDYIPNIKLSSFSLAKDILSLGNKFFFIQIAGVIQYQTTNILIAHYFDPTSVTEYNVSLKYFSILNMLFTITLMPFWSAVTDAYERIDLKWIKKSVNNYLKLWGFLVILGLVMLFISNIAYDLWIGNDKVEIDFILSVWIFLFVITSMFSGIFLSVINGTGAIRLQFYLSLITPLLFITLSLIFIKYVDFGVPGIILASIISNLTGIIVAPIQYKKIMRNASGIWTK